MMTVPSPLRGKELAKFAYLLMVPNRVVSLTAIRCYLENDACAPEVTALGARQDWSFRGPRGPANRNGSGVNWCDVTFGQRPF
jgi:hypothetical protein